MLTASEINLQKFHKKIKVKMVVPGLGASSLIASTLGIFGTGIWMVPLLLGTINYYRYDRVDPESRPIDQKQLYPEYDYIIIGGALNFYLKYSQI